MAQYPSSCWLPSRPLETASGVPGLKCGTRGTEKYCRKSPDFGSPQQRWSRISCYDSNACIARAACSFGTASSFRGTADSFAECRGLVAERRADPSWLAGRACLSPRGRRVVFSGDEGVQYAGSDDGTSMRRFAQERCASCSRTGRQQSCRLAKEYAEPGKSGWT